MSTTKIPEDRQYTVNHEWMKKSGTTGRIGITDHAQNQLGDIVFIELPEPGRVVTAGEAVGVVESVKSVADIYSPADGKVTARNDALNPETVNSDPYEEGWLFEIEIEIGADAELISAEDYRSHIS